MAPSKQLVLQFNISVDSTSLVQLNNFFRVIFSQATTIISNDTINYTSSVNYPPIQGGG